MRWLILALVWVIAAIAVLPVLFHWPARTPHTGIDGHLRAGLGYAMALLLCCGIYYVEVRRLHSRRRAVLLVFLVFLLTAMTNHLHGSIVDHGVPVLVWPNTEWQASVHNRIIQGDPEVLPHSYRFLPNAIVRWMEIAHLDYETARDLYRLIFGLLLFYTMYRYARLYTNDLGAILAMLFTALIFPVSFEHYAGQLTDPLSHLSFVLAFVFLETEDFPFLFSTLLIGSLAKETVLVMSGYYLLFGRKHVHYSIKAAALCLGSAAAYFGVRLLMLKGNMQYSQISGVTMQHAGENWLDPQWRPVFLLTVGALLPFLAVAWKTTPLSLKRQAIFLLSVLFLSGLLFSWLRETRNFMPLVFVLSVIAGRYLVLLREPSEGVSGR